MSLKKLFPVALVAVGIAGMFMLQGFFKPETVKLTEPEVKTIAMSSADVTSDWCFQNCGQGESGTQYEISEACASCWMSNFARNNYQFNEVPGIDGEMEHVQGVMIPLGDFEEVTNKVAELKGNGYIVESFGMFGLEVANEGDVPEPKVIFQVQGTLDNGSIGTPRETLVNFYYDFTNPCPTFCPKVGATEIR